MIERRVARYGRFHQNRERRDSGRGVFSRHRATRLAHGGTIQKLLISQVRHGALENRQRVLAATLLDQCESALRRFGRRHGIALLGGLGD
jgi:hypothetical protein